MEIFADHPGQSGEEVKDTSGKKKKGSGKTVSSFYKDQLNNLMTTLHATEPHFIRFLLKHFLKIVPDSSLFRFTIDQIVILYLIMQSDLYSFLTMSFLTSFFSFAN